MAINNSEKNNKAMKQWIATWQKAHDAVSAARVKELREYNYQTNKHIVDAMLQIAVTNIKNTSDSGLVIQQRLFRRLMKK